MAAGPDCLFSDLVNLDDVAVGVIEKDLLPTGHGGVPPIGKGDALVVQMRLERREIVGAIGNMPPRHGVDDVPSFEGFYNFKTTWSDASRARLRVLIEAANS